MRTTLMTLIALGVAAPAAPASAATPALDFEVTGTSVGSGQWNRLQQLLNQLNSGVVDVDLTLSAGDPNLAWTQNGVSQIAFTNNPAILSGFPALAYAWDVGTGVWECDVGVNTNVNYTTTNIKSDSNRYGGSERTLGSTLMHELGHCLGLHHNATEYNIMGDDRTHVHANGNTLYFYMGEDAANRLLDIHDANTGFEDIGIVHWRYAGNPDGNAYSDHERTVVMSLGYDDLASYTEDSGDTPVFLVRQGQTIRPEFSYENNGYTSSVGVELEFVLSTNDYITSADPHLSDSSVYMSRDDVFTVTRVVTIPASTSPGRYSLGVRATNLIGLTDDVPANNATYIDIDVLENGDADFCEGPVPCQRFEGDCDSHSDCATGLQCIWNQGEMYGFDALTDVCDLPFGSADYCSEDEPCQRHQGDCDSDSECQGSLMCIENIGAQYGMEAWVDVCDYPVGHPNYCSWQFPCDIGEGDCDSDLECAFGSCHDNVGAQYGYASNVDVCELDITGQ